MNSLIAARPSKRPTAASKTAPGAWKLTTASGSHRSNAPTRPRTRSTKSTVVNSSDIGTFLGEAFSGGTSLIDVAVRGHARGQAVDENSDKRDVFEQFGRAVAHTTSLPSYQERHAATEIKDFTDFKAK